MHYVTGAAAVGVAFWAMVAIVVVAGVIGDYKKRRIELEPVRAAIERGQPLDPALVERLMRRADHHYTNEGINPLNLRLGGIIVICVGIGVAVVALCLRPLAPVAFLPILGGAALLVCVGIGLLIGARIAEQHELRAPPRGTREAGAPAAGGPDADADL
jgi:Domain of unknown function (DUF6249)